MTIVPMIDLMKDGVKGGYAVGAFNVNNLEYLQAVLNAAQELKSPVIVSAARSEFEYMSGDTLVAIIKSYSSRYSVPVAINLDHGPNIEAVADAIKAGWTSVMYDGSMLSLEENIKNTREVVKLAHLFGVCVEGEIGTIGGTDEMELGKGQSSHRESYMADPAHCKRFVDETGIDCLAAAIGTAHGLYKLPPKLDFERLDTIRKLTKLPIVLHGGTGVPVADIQKAVSLGVGKINFSTVVRQACIETLKKTLAADPDNLDLMHIMGKSRDAMQSAVMDCMKMTKSNGKA